MEGADESTELMRTPEKVVLIITIFLFNFFGCYLLSNSSANRLRSEHLSKILRKIIPARLEGRVPQVKSQINC